MQPPSAPHAPRIVVTVADPAAQADPDAQRRKNSLYADGVVRAGGAPIVIDATASAADRARAFAAMEGLLLTGGGDIDPARYGRPNAGSVGIEAERDALEAEAWAAAAERGVPVLGLCRGMQAINVFMGGTLLQHVDGHAGPGHGLGPAMTHPIRLAPGTRLARILAPTTTRTGTLEVNSFHHQAIRPADLAPGLAPAARASSPAGEIVEAVEATTGLFVIGVQCHPERTDSTPAAFERLWRFFVDACRGPAAARR